MSRRTTKQRRSARRRRFRVHLARCRRLVAEVGAGRILAAMVAIWEGEDAVLGNSDKGRKG